MGLKENIQSNKAAILYYSGVFLVSVFNIVVSNLDDVLPIDSIWGKIIKGIADIGLIYFTIIAKFIFGRDADLDRVKIERQKLGNLNEDLKVQNEGLRITNKLQAQLLQENALNPYEYSIELKKTQKIDEL